MKILTNQEVELLKIAAQQDASIINLAFEKNSAEIALIVLSNCLTSFEEKFLKVIYGDVVLSCCSEYRTYVVNLLSSINEENQAIVLKELMIPTINKISDEELYELLNSSIQKTN